MSDQSLAPDDAGRKFPLRSAFVLCAAAAPAALILYLVLRYAIAIPMLDDWEMVPPVVKAHAGTLTFTDLFEQQQEARTFFPRLIFIALSFGKYWDGRAEMILGILICCLTSLGIYRLLARSVSLVLLLIFPATRTLVAGLRFPSFIAAFIVVCNSSRLSIRAKFWFTPCSARLHALKQLVWACISHSWHPA